MPRSEKTFFSAGGIIVTNARIVVGNQVYAMGSVSSVAFDRSRQRWGGPAMWAVLALASLWFSFENLDSGPILTIVLFAVGCAMSVISFQLGKPRYWALLRTTSGESRLVSSRDRRYVGSVVMAINEAMIARG